MEIRLENIQKKIYKQQVIKNISLTLNKGGITGLLGQNGAGKSTLMKMIVGQIQPTKGNIFIENKCLKAHQNYFNQYIGYLSEENPLYNHMYVKEFLYFFASLYSLEKKRIKKSIVTLTQHCSLQTIIHKKIENLSKGERQRVGLAKALIHDPPILILDEPTTGLDIKQLYKIRTFLKKMSCQKTILLSTHIMQEVEILCNNIIVLHQGKIHYMQNTNTKAVTSANIEKIFMHL